VSWIDVAIPSVIWGLEDSTPGTQDRPQAPKSSVARIKVPGNATGAGPGRVGKRRTEDREALSARIRCVRSLSGGTVRRAGPVRSGVRLWVRESRPDPCSVRAARAIRPFGPVPRTWPRASGQWERMNTACVHWPGARPAVLFRNLLTLNSLEMSSRLRGREVHARSCFV
jgi:hypothetical protein